MTNWKLFQKKNYFFKNLFILYLLNFIYSSLNIFVMISVISFHDFSLFRVPLFKWFNSCFHSYQFPLSFPVNRRMLTCIKPDLLWTLLILQVSQIHCHKDNFLLFFLKVKISWTTLQWTSFLRWRVWCSGKSNELYYYYINIIYN